MADLSSRIVLEITPEGVNEHRVHSPGWGLLAAGEGCPADNGNLRRPIGARPMPVAAPLPDLRRPGRPMEPLPLKLPADLIFSLQAQADRIGASRAGLARALVARGLQELEQEPS